MKADCRKNESQYMMAGKSMEVMISKEIDNLFLFCVKYVLERNSRK